MENQMKVGMVLTATDKMTSALETATKKSTGVINRLQDRFEKFKKFGLTDALVGGGIVTGMYELVSSAEEGEASQKRLTNAMVQMWGRKKEVIDFANSQGKLAEKLALQIGVDEDIIRLTQAKLATFSHVSNKTTVMAGVFDRATRAAQDMAAAGFGEAAQNAVILGKALQDPMRMATALKKQGTLTAADIVNVQGIAKTKGLLEAQKYILSAVERQVKGAAEETATMTGKMKVGWQQIVEESGKPLLEFLQQYQDQIPLVVGNTLDWIEKNKDTILTLTKVTVGIFATVTAIKAITATVSAIQGFSGTIGIMKDAFVSAKNSMFLFKIQYYGLIAAQKIATAAQWLWNAAFVASPIGWITLAVGALTAGVIWAWKNFATFRAVIKTTWEVIKGFGNVLKQYVIDRITGIITGLGAMGKAISLLFKGKFSEAGKIALQGVSDISGFTAGQNAIHNATKVISGVSSTYNNILVGEQAKDKQQDKSSVTSVLSPSATTSRKIVTHSAVHKQPVVNYTQNINITPGVNADDLMKVLRQNKFELMRVINEATNGKSRTAFG